MHINNEIPMVIPMFSGLGNMAELVRILSDRRVNGRSRMVVTTGSKHETLGSLCYSLVVLLDPENMEIAVKTSLLSCIQAVTILVFSSRDFYYQGRLKKLIIINQNNAIN